MKISLVSEKEKKSRVDAIVVPYWEGGTVASSLMQKSARDFPRDLQGKACETAILYPSESERVLCLGLGKKEGVRGEVIRRAYAAATKLAIEKKWKSLQLEIPKVDSVSGVEIFRAVCEGILLTNYAFDRLRQEKTSLLDELIFVGVEKKWGKEVDRLQVIASGVYFIRDLVNGNAHEVGPKALVKAALGIAKKDRKVKTTVLEKKQLEEEGMGLLLAVGQGAVEEPKLIIVSYAGNPQSKETTALVGKGVTFDTGGLSLKPTDNMLSMKCDMAGAATVLGAIQVAAELELKMNLIAIVPVAENAIGSRSYKVGDVYCACNGKSVEILNTDAEGRLILADAMSYAVKHLKPTRMIDLATLTGAIVIALGDEIGGLFSNDDQLAKALEAASMRTEEKVWRLPLHDYKELLRSDIADMTNVGGKAASSMTAALFLQEFVGSTSWAHFDIAGVAHLSKGRHYCPTKATGWGLRLLIDFLENQ